MVSAGGYRRMTPDDPAKRVQWDSMQVVNDRLVIRLKDGTWTDHSAWSLLRLLLGSLSS